MEKKKIVAGYTEDELLSVFPTNLLQLSEHEQKVSIKIYELLSQGAPVSIKKLAEAVTMPEVKVNNIIDRWPGVFRDYNGLIVAYWGLGLVEMAHTIKIDDRILYNWCAWDSLFIPSLIGKSTQIESTCPVTKEKIQLTVSKEGIEVKPPSTVVSFVNPEAGVKFDDNVITSFCHKVYFFSSAEAASEWIAENPGTIIISVEDAFSLGQKKNETQYKDVLEAGFGID